MKSKVSLGILGGGPSALFMYKRLVDAELHHFDVTIYEKSPCLGCGMPYSASGAEDEHITNVSANEIPDLVTSISEWIDTVPSSILNRYNIDPERFNDYKVLPRLLFGEYLKDQFELLRQKAKLKGLNTTIYYNSSIDDVVDLPEGKKVEVVLTNGKKYIHDRVVICTGHLWPKKFEGKVEGWFDSPYPPDKLAIECNYTVAVRGSSLTAIDAIRTLSKHNGVFERGTDGKLVYTANKSSEQFKISMMSRNGLLPAVRFHLEDSHLGKGTILSAEQIEENKALNNGFLSLDYVFEHNFKELIRKQDPIYYEKIRDLNMEGFVEYVMEIREKLDPFILLKAEYREAEKSIQRRTSIYWKELLAVLSFTINYPAKYFSAEDTIRMQKVLMPLISIVIAFVPQSSAETLMALYDAGRLEVIAVGDNSEVNPGEDKGAVYSYVDKDGINQEKYFELFVDCIGQPHLAYEEIPYQSLLANQTFSKALIRFRDQELGKKMHLNNEKNIHRGLDNCYYLTVPGVAINDYFQALDAFNVANDRIYVMAVPFIGGFNPDYSGLDFCEAASAKIMKTLSIPQ
ncbi:FAD/NAD(P)-binding protein [Chitinophaga rhizophila]|uniref:FAD/NAD(P)-binding protein n=1 Tax=Chitinophaga rhizophila TaxID=2866212 RepID=A0ABS7GBN0_9BACT|nr:FAD/NAD(P)-binding protein [Chitinophaga rhizophila]MBW8684736.1 FAD/NAD(P)-binding protein [Chitinophaga rhizophila]